MDDVPEHKVVVHTLNAPGFLAFVFAIRECQQSKFRSDPLKMLVFAHPE
jgi:hypothetical protein